MKGLNLEFLGDCQSFSGLLLAVSSLVSEHICVRWANCKLFQPSSIAWWKKYKRNWDLVNSQAPIFSSEVERLHLRQRLKNLIFKQLSNKLSCDQILYCEFEFKMFKGIQWIKLNDSLSYFEVKDADLIELFYISTYKRFPAMYDLC